MVGWVGVGMEMVNGMHAGQSQGSGCMSGEAGALAMCELIH